MATDEFTGVPRRSILDNLLSESSGEKSSSSEIYSGSCLLTGIKIVTDGVNDVTVTIYDNTAASGKKIDKFKVSGDENYGGALYGAAAIMAYNGLYVELSGTGGTCYVFYAEINI